MAQIDLASPMEINLQTLRKATSQILDHIEKTHGANLEIEEEYYWQIPQDERVNPYEAPATFELGQLTDDWQALQQIAAGKKSPIGFNLVWLSAVLRSLGEKYVR